MMGSETTLETKPTSMGPLRGVLLAIALIGSSAPVYARALPGGADTLSEQYGDWQVSCSAVKVQTVCNVVQTQADPKSHQRLISFDARLSEGGQIETTLLLPFGLALGSGVTLTVDTGDAGQPLPFKTCLPVGCLVPLAIDQQLLSQLEAGTTLYVGATPSDADKPLRFALPLKGFSKGFKRAAALVQ